MMLVSSDAAQLAGDFLRMELKGSLCEPIRAPLARRRRSRSCSRIGDLEPDRDGPEFTCVRCEDMLRAVFAGRGRGSSETASN